MERKERGRRREKEKEKRKWGTNQTCSMSQWSIDTSAISLSPCLLGNMAKHGRDSKEGQHRRCWKRNMPKKSHNTPTGFPKRCRDRRGIDQPSWGDNTDIVQWSSSRRASPVLSWETFRDTPHTSVRPGRQSWLALDPSKQSDDRGVQLHWYRRRNRLKERLGASGTRNWAWRSVVALRRSTTVTTQTWKEPSYCPRQDSRPQRQSTMRSWRQREKIAVRKGGRGPGALGLGFHHKQRSRRRPTCRFQARPARVAQRQLARKWKLSRNRSWKVAHVAHTKPASPQTSA